MGCSWPALPDHIIIMWGLIFVMLEVSFYLVFCSVVTHISLMSTTHKCVSLTWLTPAVWAPWLLWVMMHDFHTIGVLIGQWDLACSLYPSKSLARSYLTNVSILTHPCHSSAHYRWEFMFECAMEFPQHQEFPSHTYIVISWMVFCPVVCPVQHSWLPVETTLTLRVLISEPPELYIHWCSCFGGNSICDYPVRCQIICLHWRWWLWEPVLLQCFSHRNR